jgi:hypothetical protein
VISTGAAFAIEVGTVTRPIAKIAEAIDPVILLIFTVTPIHFPSVNKSPLSTASDTLTV